MAVAAILPQPQPVLRLLADALAHTHAHSPTYGDAFAHSLHRAVAHVEAGTAYEPYNTLYYRVQSFNRAWLWHYVTLNQCSCDCHTCWCWHRALVHLLTAQTALLTLDRCPRPTLAYIPPRRSDDLAVIVRECDDVY